MDARFQSLQCQEYFRFLAFSSTDQQILEQKDYFVGYVGHRLCVCPSKKTQRVPKEVNTVAENEEMIARSPKQVAVGHLISAS